jgi:hypothetical protein
MCLPTRAEGGEFPTLHHQNFLNPLHTRLAGVLERYSDCVCVCVCGCLCDMYVYIDTFKRFLSKKSDPHSPDFYNRFQQVVNIKGFLNLIYFQI